MTGEAIGKERNLIEYMTGEGIGKVKGMIYRIYDRRRDRKAKE